MAGGTTEGTPTGTPGAAGAGGQRALVAALAAPVPFHSSASRGAMRVSNRVVDRWASEREAATRSRSLGSLAFTDRLLQPYIQTAEQAGRIRMFGAEMRDMDPAEPTAMSASEWRGRPVHIVERSDVEPTSWVFPRPWYLDELDWIAAARAAEQRRSRGRSLPSAKDASPASIQVPDVSLEFVAPSFIARSSAAQWGGALSRRMLPRDRSARPTAMSSSPAVASPAAHSQSLSRSMRAWTPLVSFPAAQAAEVMAGAFASSPSAVVATDPADQPVAMLEYVAPREIVTRPDSRLRRSARGPGQTATAAPGRQASEAVRNRLARALRRAQEQQRVLAQRAAAAEKARSAESSARAASHSAPSATSAQPDGGEAPAERPVVASGDARPDDLESVAPPMRAVDLLVHAAASGELASSAGPRVGLPAGLGGLVAAVRAQDEVSRPLSRSFALPSRPAAYAEQPVFELALAGPALPGGTAGATTDAPGGAASRRGDVTLPAITTTAGQDSARRGVETRSAYRSVTASRPGALAHIAWADRWLARFAGASPEVLAALDITTRDRPVAGPLARSARSPAGSVRSLEALAGAAPAPLYITALSSAVKAAGSAEDAVAGDPQQWFDGAFGTGLDHSTATRPADGAAPLRSAVSSRPDGRRSGRPEEQSAPRIGDDEAVSDEVFAAIAAARARPPSPELRAERTRSTQSAEAAFLARQRRRDAIPATWGARPGEASRPDPAGQHSGARPMVDRLLEIGPVLPDAGMRTALAASPAAPALRVLLPLPTARSFDVRAVHGSQLARAYLAGIVEPSIGVLGAVPPSVGSIAGLLAAASSIAEGPTLARLSGRAPGIELIEPAGRDRTDAAEAISDGDDEAARDRRTALDAGQAGGVTAMTRVGAASREPGPQAALPTAARIIPGPLLPSEDMRAAQVAALPSPVSWSLAIQSGWVQAEATPLSALSGPGGMSAPIHAYGPGQTAARAEAWSIEQERTSADLSFDFVTPELALAARAYGLGPAEAARAARLSVAGQVGLTSLASAVDLTFVDAFARTPMAGEEGGAEWLGEADAMSMSAGPGQVAALSSSRAAARSGAIPLAEAQSSAGAAAFASRPGPTQGGPARASFGVPGRAPKGAFLWPRAAMSLLEAGSDSAPAGRSVSLAALDLLAAGAVADVGISVAPDGSPLTAAEILDSESGEIGGVSHAAPGTTQSAELAGFAPAELPVVEGPSDGSATPADSDIAELLDVAAASAASVPVRYEAIYAALSRSSAGRSMSPAVRAARALALASSAGGPGRATVSQMRAAAAWAVMPMVIPGDSEAALGGQPEASAERGWPAGARPGHSAGLELGEPAPVRRAAARAGESLQSFVAAPETPGRASSAAISPAPGAVRRPATAAQPLVETGSASTTSAKAVEQMIRAAKTRHASAGSTEIPEWFEEAARHMFEDSSGGGISLAEMTLVTAAPASHIAASPKTASSAAPSRAPESQAGSETQGEKPTEEIEEIAQRVYREICQMMRLAEMRNKGRPYS